VDNDDISELQRAAEQMLPARRADGKWLPGHSGNSAGKPVKSQTFKHLASNLPLETKQAILDKQVERAIREGSVASAEFVRDSGEGKPSVAVEVTDTSVADRLRAEVLAALAASGAITYVDAPAVEGDYREVSDGGHLAGELFSAEWDRQ
jgi:hypothetical protein